MVGGRRPVEAMVTNSCPNGKDYYSTTGKSNSSRQCKKLLTSAHADHLITQYFNIGCIQPSQANTKAYGKRKVPLNISYCPDIKIKSSIGDDANVTSSKDNYLLLEKEENVDKVFITSSPHRIKLCSQISNSNEGELQERTESNLKINANKNKLRKNEGDKAVDTKLTEYFPVRRSVRKTKQTILKEKQREIEKLLRTGIEEGLEIHNFDGKGRGVVATKSFNQGDFVVEYSGELLDVTEAKQRENIYAQDLGTGCYMYYFKFQNQQYCVDATTESGRLGRLVNHSRNGNLVTRTVVVDGTPRLALIAKEYIGAGDEISYDYGDRSKESLKHHPWLAF